MSVLYCTIPHFAAALARRDDPALAERPLILVDAEGRVWGVSPEAATCGVVVGMTAHAAEVRCPEACLLDGHSPDLARCRSEMETLLQVLEGASSSVEPHGWGAAYVDLGDDAGAVTLCRELGQAVRRELSEALQPSLGWDSSKFTARAAASCTPPGRLRAVSAVQERAFLRPLPVTFLPLDRDTLLRLGFLGLRTLGQYAALPSPAVWQQFGRPGVLAHRCARGEDSRPVVPRWQAPHLSAAIEFEVPLVERARLMAALQHLVTPLSARLRANLQACGQVRLAVQFDGGSTQEATRTFLLPVSEEASLLPALGLLLDKLGWPGGALSLAVTLEQIQDAVAEQLTLFPLHAGACGALATACPVPDRHRGLQALRPVAERSGQACAGDEGEEELQGVDRYLANRFGASRLQRAVLARPGAPLPEWRVAWSPALSGDR